MDEAPGTNFVHDAILQCLSTMARSAAFTPADLDFRVSTQRVVEAAGRNVDLCPRSQREAVAYATVCCAAEEFAPTARSFLLHPAIRIVHTDYRPSSTDIDWAITTHVTRR